MTALGAAIVDMSSGESTLGADSVDIPVENERRIPHPKENGQKSIRINIETIIISVFIFVTMLTWFELLRMIYDILFSNHRDWIPIYKTLGYAISFTVFSIISIFIIYCFFFV
jgi:hypothetical protein